MDKLSFLKNIEDYCDMETVDEINEISFWELEYWSNVQITYNSWNSDSYLIK